MLSLLDLTAEKWSSSINSRFNLTKQSIVGYESCIFGRRLLLRSSILRQDFRTIGKLQEPAAARVIFVVVATSGAEGCRRMLSGSLHQ